MTKKYHLAARRLLIKRGPQTLAFDTTIWIQASGDVAAILRFYAKGGR